MLTSTVPTKASPNKRGRKKREKEDGISRTQRERQCVVSQALRGLKLRLTELDVPDVEAGDLLSSVTDALQLFVDGAQLNKERSGSTASTNNEPDLSSAPANTADSVSTSVSSAAAGASIVDGEVPLLSLYVDSTHRITRNGRDFTFKDATEDPPIKFHTMSDALKHYQKNLAAIPKEFGPNIKKTYVDYFCNYCLNDPFLDVCAFCGCRKCFGKFAQSEDIIICKDCEMEFHSYCCTPATLNSYIFYCASCKEKVDERDLKKRSLASSHPTTTEVAVPLIAFSVPTIMEAVPKKNRVGRPKGSLNKATEFRLNASASSSEARAVSVESALAVLESDSIVRLSDSDTHILNQMRVWGPSYDLEAIVQALESKKKALFDLITSRDPSQVAMLENLEEAINQDVLSRLQDDYPKIVSSHGQIDLRTKSRKIRKRRKKKLPQIMLGFRGKGRKKRVRLEGVALSEALVGGDEMMLEEAVLDEEGDMDAAVYSPDVEEQEDDDETYEPDDHDSL